MIRRVAIALIAAVICALSVRGAEVPDTVIVPRGTVILFTEGNIIKEGVFVDGVKYYDMPYPVSGSIHAKPTKAAKAAKPKVHIKPALAWGADVGATIDMSGNDMSNFNVGLSVGMKRGWINFLGVGAQANIYISSSMRSYPLYLRFRTNFSDKPSRWFWEVQSGLSLNYLEENRRQTGVYASTGFGFRLASSNKFSSHILVGYAFMDRRRITFSDEHVANYKDLHFATVKLGVTF